MDKSSLFLERTEQVQQKKGVLRGDEPFVGGVHTKGAPIATVSIATGALIVIADQWAMLG